MHATRYARSYNGLQWQCGDNDVAGSASGKGYKMIGITSRTPTVTIGYNNIDYGYYCLSDGQVTLLNYGTENSYNTGNVPVSTFVNGARYTKVDVLSLEFAAENGDLEVCVYTHIVGSSASHPIHFGVEIMWPCLSPARTS